MNSLPACTFRAACVLCLIGLYSAQQPARAAQSIALEDEIAVSFTVPPGSFSNDFYFEVAEGTRKFRLDLNGNEGDAGDVDLYLRYAQPFPDTDSYGREPGSPSEAVNWLNRLAHYSSAAAGNEEFLIISEHNVRPPTAGR